MRRERHRKKGKKRGGGVAKKCEKEIGPRHGRGKKKRVLPRNNNNISNQAKVGEKEREGKEKMDFSHLSGTSKHYR